MEGRETHGQSLKAKSCASLDDNKDNAVHLALLNLLSSPSRSSVTKLNYIQYVCIYMYVCMYYIHTCIYSIYKSESVVCLTVVKYVDHGESKDKTALGLCYRMTHSPKFQAMF